MSRTAKPDRIGRARGLALAVLGALLVGAGAPALAADFRSIGTAAAVLYDGPSLKGRKLHVAPRGMPVEVLSEVNQWVKIRDQGGDVLWIEKKDLSSARSPVSAANAVLRSAAQDNAPVTVQLDRGVPLTIVEGSVPAGWLRVRLPDGSSGFLRSTDVWGL